MTKLRWQIDVDGLKLTYKILLHKPRFQASVHLVNNRVDFSEALSTHKACNTPATKRQVCFCFSPAP